MGPRGRRSESCRPDFENPIEHAVIRVLVGNECTAPDKSGLQSGLHSPSRKVYNPVPRTCVCGREFIVARKEVLRGRGKFCSTDCAHRNHKSYCLTPDSTKAERVRANGLVNMRVRRGTMAKPARCSWCQRKTRLDSHHEDYAKPAEVLWLCRSCHSRIHHGHSGPCPINVSIGRRELAEEQARQRRRPAAPAPAPAGRQVHRA